MRIFFLITLSICFFSLSEAQKNTLTSSDNKSIEKIINSQWTFNYFPEATAESGYESPGFDDYGWPAVSLPHTWNTYETTGDIHPYIKFTSETENPYWWNGWGWYRKRFTINTEYAGRKIFVVFEGVQKFCKVWINGKYLGDHKGGYGRFDFDLTDHINQGKENVLAVAVSNSQNDRFKIPPMQAGRFNVYGGIYRNVKLIIKDKLYIPVQGSSEHEGGTIITTPRITASSAVVRVRTWVKNDHPQAKPCVLVTTIYDATGRPLKAMKSKFTLSSGQLYQFDQTFKPLPRPHLWSPEDPYLYKITSELTDGGRIVDSQSSPLAFRWFRWNYGDNSLYLNGKKIELKGIERSEEYPWLGGALTEWITLTELENLKKEKSYNLLKTPYPGTSLAYDFADKNGLIVIEETPSTGNLPFATEVQEKQIKEMIRRDRNHPGIFFWSMGNETDHAADSRFAVTEDTTRIITSRKTLNNSAGPNAKHNYENILIDEYRRIPFTGYIDRSADIKQTEKRVPSRIVLKASHNKIEADRASIVIVTADIVDSQGDHVEGAANTVKWSVSGPGLLAGPVVYESASGNSEKVTNSWYTAMPVVNIIRSSGEAGQITVTASASGISSGVAEIEAAKSKPDNSIVTEPELRNEGRRAVTRLQFGVDRLEDVPVEIRQTNTDIDFSKAEAQDYPVMLRDYLIKNNPDVDSTTVEFRELVNLFSSQMRNNKGHLVAYDYNFSVDHFNNCRLISGYINATKLPALFKEALRKYYAEAIISRGSEKNAGDEMNWMNWIPSGGIVIISQDPGGKSWSRGTVITNKSRLEDLIAAVHPVFTKYNNEARERALTFVGKMNPYVKVETIKEVVNGAEVVRMIYTAEKGKPVLIPELKFISQ
jgi:hypothetical protein